MRKTTAIMPILLFAIACASQPAPPQPCVVSQTVQCPAPKLPHQTLWHRFKCWLFGGECEVKDLFR